MRILPKDSASCHDGNEEKISARLFTAVALNGDGGSQMRQFTTLFAAVVAGIALSACSVTTGGNSDDTADADVSATTDAVVTIPVPSTAAPSTTLTPMTEPTDVGSTDDATTTTEVVPTTTNAPSMTTVPTPTTSAPANTDEFEAMTATLPVDDDDRWTAWNTERCGLRAVVLNGPAQWGSIDNADGSATPEFALWHHADGEWIRTDHSWLGDSTTTDTATFAFSSAELIILDGLDEPVLVTSLSSADGPSATVRILDTNCNWWTRPVITPCGVVAAPQAVTQFPASVTIMMSDAIDAPEWPCSVGDPWPIVWNEEFRMPTVDPGAQFCSDYVPTEVDDPMQAMALTTTACTRGDVITAAQSLLVDRGVAVDVDGEFGPGTLRAVMRFQRDNGLDVTGRLDPATWSRLRPAGE
ncbi:MAG: peptidoglycan-binding protein [Actinomycetota bacterium]|nr:peptidoglycan-binding protein [Actinomycetota bacterium]